MAGATAAAAPASEALAAAAAAAEAAAAAAVRPGTTAGRDTAGTSAVSPAPGTQTASVSSAQAIELGLASKLAGLWASSCALWSDNAGLDSLVMRVGGLSYGGYSLRLAAARAGLMSVGEHAQNASLVLVLLALAAFSSRRPRAYRPLAPLLRLLLLCYAFGFPVFASLPAAATFTPPAPSQVPLLGPLVDGYHLWMSTRAAMMLISTIVTRPPLHVAIPLQALALWRASHAGYCSMPLLTHPAMRQRTDLLHWAMSHVAAACAFPISSHVVPKGDTPRCQAALLFSNLLLGGLLPLLLLAPSGSDARRGPLASSALARLERGLCRALRLFIHEQHPGEGGHTERVFLLPPLVLRWVVLVTCTWCCCCLLYS